MNTKDTIRHSIEGADKIVAGYLGDLTDAELLVRPVPGANHIAWQLGHLIAAENMLIGEIAPERCRNCPRALPQSTPKKLRRSTTPKHF